MNRTELSASVVERNLLRYTPAGVPVSECVLRHASEQTEARQVRQVELDLQAIALGSVAGLLDQARLGVPYRFVGFLARKSRKSRSFTYHITAFELETEE